MILLLLGAPGSGKGTLSSYLMEQGYAHISTGDLLREEVASGSELGKELKALMDQGKFASAEVVNNLVKTNLTKLQKEGKDIILDGYPRNVEQAKYLETYTNIDKVVEIVVPDSLIIKRIVGRWSCPKCGFPYNINTSAEFKPLEKDGKYYCKTCNVELKHRSDDNEDTVQKRLDTYREQTQPLVDYYSAKGNMITIDGNLSKGELLKAVKG